MKNWIGISLGDVTGVGPEVALKAVAAEAAADDTQISAHRRREDSPAA